MKKLIIRECSIEDLEDILLLQHQWVKEDITHGLIPVEKSYIETKLGKYFLVAESDSKIIGFVYGSIHTADNMAVIDNGQLYIEVEDIYVASDYRGTGLGSSLLDEILHIAKGNGIDRSLIYSSTKDMEGIISFYKKHNYKTWYIQMFK
ncbi:GNAT family N-acetyltransferase [Clostridium swellfunianum]|uniref:GNAT family N-acetyltransferase n=1 Tax=Clostridium swellfunianum TaxID=1367462 RepID=UPI002030C03B|nr:GNAT family N-acetyltransferase [Clostridium swellfunianum]MCM0650187.1 GNAT family N-acetyltransferase [Clostridium swellfunianum]